MASRREVIVHVQRQSVVESERDNVTEDVQRPSATEFYLA